MATPVVETIATTLAGYINAITEAAGFNQDLTAVRPKRIHLEGDLNADNTVIIEQESADIFDQTSTTITWRQGFTLQAIVIDSDEATDAIDTRLNKIRSDIEKKLCHPDNVHLGGLAEGVIFKATEKFISDPQLAGIAVNIDVIYTTNYSDPYSQSAV